jgi:apurinic endonuclease APN1
VGATFKQLAQIRNKVHAKHKIGFAFDTCHAFAAGYNFSDPDSYHALWKDFDDILGLQHLKAMHINDSKKECGCRVDRHEDIGKGKIGLEAFRLLFNDPRFFDIPKILETPQDELQDYARNMHVLRELISEKTEKTLGI